MAVYVDEANILWRGSRWCHLYADSLTELKKIANLVGLKPEWIQDKGFPHFDVTGVMLERCKKLGAVQVTKKDDTYKKLRQQFNRGEYPLD